MLSDADSRKERQASRKRGVGPASSGKHWSDSQKIEAVTLTMTLGNLALAASALKIPEDTLRRWRKSQWWQEIEGELKYQDNLQFSTAAKNLIEKSMGVIADRLDNGDWIYDQKLGEMRRKPVSTKDALAVADKMMEKKILLDKGVQQLASDEAIEDKLNKLMDRFSALATAKPPVIVTDVIEVNSEENENSLHDQRPA